MKYLLDTNQVVYWLRNDRRVVNELLARKDEGLAVSIISVAELYEAVFRASDPDAAEGELKDFLAQAPLLGVDEEVGRVFGRERARLRQLGTPMSDLDLLITFSALRYGLTLLTADKDFQRVANLNIIFS